MGYSVAAPVRSAKAHARMLAFLDRHYKTWPELNGGTKDDPSYIRGPLGDDFSYDHGKCRIGFDHNSAGGEREYMLCVVRWVALRVGRKHPKTKKPYYDYDGGLEGRISIVQGRQPKKDETLTDQWGVPLEPKPSCYPPFPQWPVQWILDLCEEPKALEVIRAELQRLDALWEETP